MRRGRYILIFVLLLCSMKTAFAQSRNNLFIESDRLVLEVDIKSPVKTIDSILKLAGVTTANTAKIVEGNFKPMSDDGWSMTIRNGDIVTFNRPLAGLNENPQSSPLEITVWLPEFAGSPGYPKDVKYGVNKFSKNTVFGLSSGLTRFILPGYTRARRVFLSGSFNNWSTLKGAMKRIDGGWIIDIKLEPGAYEYKFIADGRWTTDPNNLLKVNDGDGNTNSVFYKYNYTVKLPGYQSARKVVLTGDFNKWNTKEIILEQKGGGWQKQMYLSDGRHEYHFLVDGRTVTDPVNTAKIKDSNGNLNAVLNLGETTTFKLAGFENAKRVFLSGNFNGWKPSNLGMDKTAGGWSLNTTLTAGNYQYKFVVDGKWITDPANPYYATEKGVRNSFLAVKPNQTFRLKGHANAKKVTLNGTFNNWDEDGYTMARVGDDWVISMYLKKGKYLYKFRVDDEWIIDPGNRLWEENEHGTGNSVLWME